MTVQEITIKNICYELWTKETVVGCFPLLASYSFRFLLEAAFHQYGIQHLNNLYIEKHDFDKWKQSISPNVWHFFLDFSNGESRPAWQVNGTIDMNKIREKYDKRDSDKR